MSEAIAVISDIHGNVDALKAVLADIDRLGITHILNLGDHLSGPLAARETADLLMARDMRFIAGNHDRWLVELTRDEMSLSDQIAYDQLEEPHLTWLRAMPETAAVGADIFMCHGTPKSDETYWMERASPTGGNVLAPLDEIVGQAQGIDAPVILCGHTHIPRSIRLPDGRLLVNPGSVGLQAYSDTKPFEHAMQSGSPDASYAVLEKVSSLWSASLRRVPYDSARMVAMAKVHEQAGWESALIFGRATR